MKLDHNIALISKLVIAAFFLVSLGVNAYSASGSELSRFKNWDVVGPSGGDVRVVTFDPRNSDRLYVSTLDGQIHTSGDGGRTWNLLVNLNRPQLILDQLFVDSVDSNIIYTSGHRHKEPGGFYKSIDGGKTWKESRDLKNASIHAMTQSVKNPETLVVGTIDGAWISNNKGDSWTKIESSTMPINIGSIAIDPRNDGTIYAGTWWRPYKSTDSGRSWRLIKNGMIDDSDVFAITINQSNPDHLVASACSGIYESFNSGEKWAKIQGIPSQSRRTRDILQHPGFPGTIYAATTEGFWMTSNAGKTWALTTQRNLQVNSIAVHPSNPNRIFIGTNNDGVMVSNDGGRNFVRTNGNFTSRFIYSVTADNSIPERLYAIALNTASGGGFLFISPDGGANWVQAKNLDENRVTSFGIIQDRIVSTTLYLATNVGIFRSFDRGMTWSQIAAPKPARVTTRRGRASVAPPPNPSGFVTAFTGKVKFLIHTQDGKNGYLAGTEDGLYRSYDISKGWEYVPFGNETNASVFIAATTPLQPRTIWAGTARSGLKVSRDNGETWRTIDGIPNYIPISAITIDPQDADKIYVGSAQAFYLSRDGGQSWTRRGGNLPLGNYSSIIINPRNTDEIYASSSLQSDGGLYFSNDAGGNWIRLDSKDLNLPSHRIWSLAFDPTDSNRIFAATHSSGVYVIRRRADRMAESNDTRPRQVAEN